MTDQEREFLAKLVEAVVETDQDMVMNFVSKGLAMGIEPLDLVNEGLTAGLRRVGDLFAEEMLFLPELILAGEIVTEAVDSLADKLAADGATTSKGSIILATVEGDVHDIGKNLVGLIMSASGFEVIDLGKDVSTHEIVKQVIDRKPDCLGLSALLSTTMVAQIQVVDALVEAGVRDQVKVMVGGAPVTRSWAEKIGADGWAEDASSAAVEAERILSV